MSATSRRRSSLGCLLAVALTATACGSGSAASSRAAGTSGTPTTSAAATSAAATSAAATSAAPATSAGTTTSSATGAPASAAGSAATSTPAPATTTTVKATGGGEFCKTIANAVNNPVTPSGALATSLKDEKALIEKSLAQGEAALSKAPAEIRPDAEIVLTAIDNLFKALEKADYDYTKIDPKAMAGVSAPAVTAAEARLVAYVKSSCGFSIGTS